MRNSENIGHIVLGTVWQLMRIISHDKTFECCQFHTGTNFSTKLEIASVYVNTLMYVYTTVMYI